RTAFPSRSAAGRRAHTREISMLRRLTAVAMAAAVGLALPAMAQNGSEKDKTQPKVKAKEQPKKQDSSLRVGDKAPAMTVEEWVKGDKVEKFQEGKVYVVEFW